MLTAEVNSRLTAYTHCRWPGDILENITQNTRGSVFFFCSSPFLVCWYYLNILKCVQKCFHTQTCQPPAGVFILRSSSCWVLKPCCFQHLLISLTSNASFNVTVGYWQQRAVKMGYFTGEIIPVCCWNTVTEQQLASLLAPQDTGYVKPCLIFLISLHLDHKGLLN